MRISKVKIWLQVKNEIINPFKKAKEIILNSPNEEQLKRSTVILETIAANLDSMMAYVEYRMELEKIGVQKILRYTKENHVDNSHELIAMKVSDDIINCAEDSNKSHLQYLNYIADQGAPIVELYHYYA